MTAFVLIRMKLPFIASYDVFRTLAAEDMPPLLVCCLSSADNMISLLVYIRSLFSYHDLQQLASSESMAEQCDRVHYNKMLYAQFIKFSNRR